MLGALKEDSGFFIMHLLTSGPTGSFVLKRFSGLSVPPYAILSHTWGDEDQEMTFEDIARNSGHKKSGYKKVQLCARQARLDGLEYFWVDSCCIDKKSSAELSEAINSMYEWYSSAAVCYVFLDDLQHGQIDDVTIAERAGGLGNCRWFTRGWTLQELIAPGQIIFYDQAWRQIGTKESLTSELESVTGIGQEYLRGHKSPRDSSIARRMSWLADRTTTRAEDIAYCMLGIFDVNMPLLYGEGLRAFTRLQEELIR
jgi:hypothetical protein